MVDFIPTLSGIDQHAEYLLAEFDQLSYSRRREKIKKAEPTTTTTTKLKKLWTIRRVLSEQVCEREWTDYTDCFLTTWETTKPECLGSSSLTRFLGMEMFRHLHRTWMLNQVKYTNDLLRRNLGNGGVATSRMQTKEHGRLR